MKICFGLLCSLTLATLFISPAQAHYPWINIENYTADTGSSPYITIGWGHRYPLSRFLQKDSLEQISIIGADGKNVELTNNNPLEFSTKEALSNPGPYIIAAKRKAGFYTKTTHGGKRQSKKGLDDVLYCSFSHMSMKAVLNVGENNQNGDSPIGHDLEIIPLINPGKVRAGDYFPLRVLLHGKPYKGEIYATYMGFSTEKDVFAYTAKTDHNGYGKIRILQPGVWLIKTAHQDSYPDPEVCDTESYIATLTLEIK